MYKTVTRTTDNHKTKNPQVIPSGHRRGFLTLIKNLTLFLWYDYFGSIIWGQEKVSMIFLQSKELHSFLRGLKLNFILGRQQ